MKKLILALMIAPLTAQAAQSQNTTPSATEKAIETLISVSTSGGETQLAPGAGKAMLLEFAIKNQRVSDEQEFNERFSEDVNEAWAADNATWGMTTADDAEGYVDEALGQIYDDNGEQDPAKVAADREKARAAFEVLKADKSLSYGIAPMGAIQCGITLSELVILDEATGKAYEVQVEQSGGC